MLTLLFVGLAAPARSGAQCPAHPPLGPEPLLYKHRGGPRCEGRSPVDHTILGDVVVIISVTGRVDPYAAGEAAFLFWRAPAAQNVNVRGVGVRSGVNYRLDLHTPGAAPFRWPLDVFDSLGLDWTRVGFMGEARITSSGSTRDVMLPVDLSLTRDHPTEECFTVTVTAVSGALLDGAVMRLQLVDSTWLPVGEEPAIEVSLPTGAYGPGTPLEFTSTCLQTGSRYAVDIEPLGTGTTLPAAGYIVIP